MNKDTPPDYSRLLQTIGVNLQGIKDELKRIRELLENKDKPKE